jgi:hypothetical protein
MAFWTAGSERMAAGICPLAAADEREARSVAPGCQAPEGSGVAAGSEMMPSEAAETAETVEVAAVPADPSSCRLTN